MEWTILEVLDWTTDRLAKAGVESPRLDAQVMLAHILKCDRVALYTNFNKPLSEAERAGFRESVKRRLSGEPIAYIVGEKEFWSQELKVSKSVLVPRGDTETLVQVVLDIVDDANGKVVVDVGTGSGAIAIALASEWPGATVKAVDISADACAIATANTQASGASVEVLHGNLLEPLGVAPDVVVSNPPYIPSADIGDLSAEVQSEPRQALDGGKDGLEIIRKLVGQAADKMTPGGLLALEHGADQGSAVREILKAAGFVHSETRQDLAHLDRVTFGFMPQ